MNSSFGLGTKLLPMFDVQHGVFLEGHISRHVELPVERIAVARRRPADVHLAGTAQPKVAAGGVHARAVAGVKTAEEPQVAGGLAGAAAEAHVEPQDVVRRGIGALYVAAVEELRGRRPVGDADGPAAGAGDALAAGERDAAGGVDPPAFDVR